jgi:hypothetical protein
MAHDLTDLHALAGGVGASLRFGGRHVPTAAGPWNVAAGGAAEGKWGALTGEAASVLERLAALLPGALFHRLFEASQPVSRVSFSRTEAKKSAAKRPHREHFVAQEIA